MSLKRPHSPTSLASSALYVSKKIEDRDSTFTAYFSPTAPQRQLQSHPDLTTASHRILAWRKPSSQRTLTGLPAYNTGSDDDGENYAAKEAIRAYLADKDESANGESAKKTKVSNDEQGQEDEKEKEDLVEELKNRDESIVVLRNLLDDKMGKKKKSEETPDAGEESSQQRPTKEVDYKSMPLVRLKQLDKARDNTISFLLKKIDEVEEAQEKILIRSEDEGDNKDAPKT
ncbi:hypothetical protein TWF173_001778 [Orbilia oligospora]|nr:hypothetical protein TWF173_001778 [Orbilia oligospora]